MNYTKEKLKAPFPYFGAKSTVASDVWNALGDVSHYMEPFFGSGAVLLARPGFNPEKHTETVNDKDGFICNVWRAIRYAPDEVADWCDYPVNHIDLNARRRKLLAEEKNLVEKLTEDEIFYDAKLAGYWIWAASCWIGSGLTRPNARPHLSGAGMGVHSKNTSIYEWMNTLSERLRNVRVTCGDWEIICGGNWQNNMGTVGIFFDPPYGVEDRDTNIYHHDCTQVASEVNAWAVKRGSKTDYRIVIAGYEGEHENLVNEGWRLQRWSAGGGYANTGNGQSRGNKNRHREILWFSPHCRKANQEKLFD